MSPALALLALWALLLTGHGLLALSQDSQRRPLGIQPLRGRALLIRQFIGFSLLLLTLPLAVWRDGPGAGVLLWEVSLTATAAPVVVLLGWRPAWLRRLAGSL